MNYNKRILIFSEHLYGHYLEYIHHLYNGACKYKEIDFIFSVPKEFQEMKNMLNWKKSDNIVFHYFSRLDFNSNGFVISKSIKKSKFVRDIAKLHSVNEVFFISLIRYLPMIAFFIPKNVRISGIIYLIYLYRWKVSKLLLKFQDIIKYFLLNSQSNFKTVFLLNDTSAPFYLNKKLNTDKFTYLPDPYVPIDESNLINFREKYEVSNENIVFSHLGTLTKRKGTLKILDAIDSMDEIELKNKSFIFAGRIKDDIKVEFYDKYSKLKNKVQILYFDEFCEYSFLGSICLSSTFILLPYSNTAQSSGIIGYGAQFKVPVVVPNGGLLGKLVKKYKLGYTVDLSSGKEIADFIKQSQKTTCSTNTQSKYILDHSVSNFNKAIFSRLV